MNEYHELKSLGVGAKVLRTFVLGSECSREQKFLLPGAKVPGKKVPGSEWNFRSRERKFLGAKVPVTSPATKRACFRETH